MDFRMSLVACELGKSFGPVRAVCGVDFQIAPGEIVGLIGPNGSGKSTVLRMLATFLRPTMGRAMVAGFDCVGEPQRVRRSLGYLPEHLPGFTEARVEEYLEFRARLKEISRAARRAEVDRCLAACDLVNVRRRLLGQLSQGFRRRVGLADALLGAPPVLLLDEPTIGLDPLQVRATRELLTGLAERTTILLSTHLLAEAEAVCTRALILVQGQLLSDVALAELRAGVAFDIELIAPGTECVAILSRIEGVQSVSLQSPPPGAATCLLRLTTTADNARQRVVRECVARGWGVHSLHSTAASLEEHFMRMALAPRKEAA